MKFLKSSIIFLFAVLLQWGGLVLFAPNAEEDDILHIVLDPGHGGTDPGAVVGVIYEKDINLAIALMVRDILAEQENIVVSMTRDDDSYPSLTERAEFANKIDADLYVSIHANALDDTSYSGLFTFYYADMRNSKKPAELIQNAASAETGAISRGVRTENYTVLRKTNMPAVLVETGFMTCQEELTLLCDIEYQMKMAKGIAKGIEIFAEQNNT